MKKLYKYTTLIVILMTAFMMGCGDEYTPPEYKPGTGGSDLVYTLYSYGDGYEVYAKDSGKLVYTLYTYGDGYEVYAKK